MFRLSQLVEVGTWNSFQVIKNAFQCFDEDNSGYLNEDRLRELLTTMGDRYTDEQVC